MKRLRNITLSADPQLIDLARRRASEQQTTLNAAFRDWLRRYTSSASAGTTYDNLMRRLQHVGTDRPLTREGDDAGD